MILASEGFKYLPLYMMSPCKLAESVSMYKYSSDRVFFSFKKEEEILKSKSLLEKKYTDAIELEIQ